MDFYPLLQGIPAVLHPEMPRDVHPPSEIVLKPQDQRIPKPEDHEVPGGKGASLGALSITVPAVGWKRGLGAPRAVQAVPGLARSVTRGGSGTAHGREGMCPPGAAPNSHRGSRNPSLEESNVWDCVCATAGLEPNEARNSLIISDHFFNWRPIMEL